MRLEARSVTVRLRGRLVLDRVSLAPRPGEITGIIGPNGAGKSTLLRTLAGVLPCAAGEVVLDGVALPAWARPRLARVLAYLPQARAVHWALSVRNVVGLGRQPYRSFAAAESAADVRAVAESMRMMDVVHLAERPVTDLSGGELARVLIARALAQEPAVLVADEPTAGLDPAHQLALFRSLSDIAGAGRTVVVALHDLSLAARFCHSIGLLAGGAISASGPPQAVLTEANLAAAYGVRAALAVLDGIPVVQVRNELP